MTKDSLEMNTVKYEISYYQHRNKKTSSFFNCTWKTFLFFYSLNLSFFFNR